MDDASSQDGNVAGTSDKIHSPVAPTWYSPQALADLLGVGTRRVRQLLAEAGIGKIAGRFLLTADDLEVILRRQSGKRSTQMERTRNKSIALESFIRLSKRLDKQDADIDDMRKRIWSVEKSVHAFMDEVAEIRKAELDCQRRQLDQEHP